MRWRSAEELLNGEPDPLERAAALEDQRLEALEVASEQPWARRLVAALMTVEDEGEAPVPPVEEKTPAPAEPEATAEPERPTRKGRPPKPRRRAAPWVELGPRE